MIDEQLLCYHCGEECTDDSISANEKTFCCNGCKTIYEIFEQNNLCDYYAIDQNPGINRKYSVKRNYDFLDDKDLIAKLLDFTNGKTSTVTLDIPQMHCSSCIWILENLNRLDAGVISSKVNFLQKKIFIRYAEAQTSLRNIVELLDSLGYEPLLNLEEKNKESDLNKNKSLFYKIGIAGFAFGNIMLLSFPEYLSLGTEDMPELKRLFAYINIFLSLPVFFYSSSDYFSSAWKGLRKKIVNIDVPLALGILVLFFRSIIEIIFNLGPGYLDSLAGLVFFLLIGKVFQNKTYDTLNFERDYKSYFPISVTTKKENLETSIPVEKLSVGDRIIIRNNELIPADAVVMKGSANIDYGFVTGESIPETVSVGEIIYAGGKQIGGAIELEIIKDVSQSYLTRLWNNHAFHKNEDESRIESFANYVSKYFTFGILLIASVSAIYWWNTSVSIAFNAFTAVLIIACPCALALSTPFALGNTMRIFGKNKFYLKNTHTIEKLASIDSIIFDKTGTITESGSSEINFIGEELNDEELAGIKSCVRNSSHPLSRELYNFIKIKDYPSVETFEEEPGKGISALVQEKKYLLGSEIFVTGKQSISDVNPTEVYVSIDNKVKGRFVFSNKYRDGLKELISNLEQEYSISLLSGDSQSETENLKKLFGNEKELNFKQSPQDKLDYVKNEQLNNKFVLMIGDGLNDSGALKQSDIGISISDDVNNFSPACDGILDSKMFGKLNDFIHFSKTSKKVIYASFIISLVYNSAGLYFAVQGTLSPVIAAILMPISSITAVAFTTFATSILAKRKGLI